MSLSLRLAPFVRVVVMQACSRAAHHPSQKAVTCTGTVTDGMGKYP